MKNRTDKSWAKTHSDVLKYVFRLLNVDKVEFAEELFVSEATVRQWLSGRGFPDAKNISALYQKIEKRVDDDIGDDLSQELINYLTETFCLIDDSIQFDPANQKLGQYLVAKLKNCYAKGKLVKSVSAQNLSTYKPSGFTKAVVFDFDGTLTEGSSIRTTWESIWISLGYDIQECRDLHKRFDKKEITHPEWCDITAQKFRAKYLHRDTLDKIAEDIKLIKGCKETFLELSKRYIKIYIVSGSILSVIQKSLNGLYRYVDDVKANDFIFSPCGTLTEIIGTAFDFEGKATYIMEIANKLRISTEDILFVGNSYNDKYAYISGARTLCINPKNTDPSEFSVWNDCIYDCNNLTQILNYVRFL